MGSCNQAEGARDLFPVSSSRRGGKAELWQAACSLLGEADPAVLIGRERNGALSHADRKE